MPRPHIVLITADQLRKDALGCYGGEAVATPNLDRLASQGTRYDRAYTASPWCMPSRTSILTGQLPHNHGAYSNFRHDRLQPGTPNLYSHLHDAGYTTAHVGKCHYAAVPYKETRPDATLPYQAFRDYYVSLGIDHLDLQDDKQVSVWFEDDYARELDAAGHLAAYRDAVWNKNHRKVFPFPGPPEWHPDAWVGRKATAVIDAHPDDQPLFLWASLSGPHFPFDAPDAFLDRVDQDKVGQGAWIEGEFDDPARIHHTSYHGPAGIEGAGPTGGQGTSAYDDAYWAHLRTRYFANVALIDDQVGAILDAIERRFGNDVLVIFTADHGEMLGNHRLWGKHNCAYEDVLNVPLLVREPGSRGGEMLDPIVMLTDLAPTCLAAANAAPLPAADGAPLAHARDDDRYTHAIAEGGNFLTVFDGTMKYVTVRKGDRRHVEMFDLAIDPCEFTDVAADPAYATHRAALQQVALNLLMDATLEETR